MAETTNHPVETHLGISLDGASPSDYNVNDPIGENLNGFMDSLVFSDKEASMDSRDNVSNNNRNDATNTVADSSDDANNNNDANEQQINITPRSIDL